MTAEKQKQKWLTPAVRSYLREIGRRGGSKSRRTITAEQQAKMQAGRKRKCEPEQMTCRQCRNWIPAPGVDRDTGLCRRDSTYRGLCPAGHTCGKWMPNAEPEPRRGCEP